MARTLTYQTKTFKQRMRKLSGLSPMARHVAGTIADLRYEGTIAHHEPLSISLTDLAAECGWSHKNTIRRYLAECLEAGWVIAREVFIEGRQQNHEYFVADPTDPTEYTRVYSAAASRGRILSTCAWSKSSMRMDTVLRSKNKGSGPVPPEGSRVPSTHDVPTSPCGEPPADGARQAPALGGAGPTTPTPNETEPVPEPEPARPVAAESETTSAGDEGMAKPEGMPWSEYIRSLRPEPERSGWRTPQQQLDELAAMTTGADERDDRYLDSQQAQRPRKALVPA